MTLVVFIQEDENAPSVYRNLKNFCETAPCILANWKFPFLNKLCKGTVSKITTSAI